MNVWCRAELKSYEKGESGLVQWVLAELYVGYTFSFNFILFYFIIIIFFNLFQE
jgi:hypothetical protein